MYAATIAALPHHLLSSLAFFSRALIMLNRVLQARSETPFCSDVLAMVSSRWILLSKQNLVDSFEMYSPPLSDRKALRVCEVSMLSVAATDWDEGNSCFKAPTLSVAGCPTSV